MFSADLGVNSNPPATDPSFQKVAMLLHGDGTNGAQNNTFVDSSTNNFTITRTGNVAQGTFSPFSLADGQWSNYFDGTSAYETVATNSVFTYGTNDFTIECWFYLGKIGAQQQLIDQRNSGTATAIIPTLYVSSSNVLTYYVNGSAVITGATALSVGSWYHVAVARSSTSTKMFLNGTQEGSTYSDSNNYAASRVVLGAQASSAANYLQGYLSNVRLVKGTAVYTSNFTVPTSSLTAITNTSLLACQSNRFIDNSSNAFSITLSGTPKVTAFSPFAPSAAYDANTNGGSGYFDGSGDNLTLSSGSAFQFGTGDFTVEFWVYVLSNPTAYYFIDARNSSQTGAWAFLKNTTLLEWYDGSASLTASPVPTLNQWNHVSYCRSGTTGRMFLNGVQIASRTDTKDYNVSPTTSYIASRYSSVEYFNGYLTNLRVIKGTALYTSNFTPPTAPLTAITNTQLLLNCTNAAIYDNAGKNDIETVGNAQISTSVKKYGTGSMYFDGTGDWLYLADRPELQLGTGNFTIEGWLYLGATGMARGIVGKGTSTTGWLLSTDSSNQVVFTYGSSTITSTGTLSGSTWYHIAVCREGTGSNQTKIYIGGVNDGTGTVSTDFNQTNVMYVGADRTGGSALNGYIDDLRITKGIARYTSNFTPPTQAFPNV